MPNICGFSIFFRKSVRALITSISTSSAGNVKLNFVNFTDIEFTSSSMSIASLRIISASKKLFNGDVREINFSDFTICGNSDFNEV